MNKAWTLALVGAMSLGGCGFSGIGSGDSGLLGGGGIRGNSSQIEGIRFRSRVSSTSEDDRGFAVRTAGAGRGLVAAAEAGRTEANRYCLRRFGGTEIDWITGPSDQEEDLAISDDGSLVLTGRCLRR